MHRRASSWYGAGNALVGQMSRQLLQLPQWSVSGVSGDQLRIGQHHAKKEPGAKLPADQGSYACPASQARLSRRAAFPSAARCRQRLSPPRRSSPRIPGRAVLGGTSAYRDSPSPAHRRRYSPPRAAGACPSDHGPGHSSARQQPRTLRPPTWRLACGAAPASSPSSPSCRAARPRQRSPAARMPPRLHPPARCQPHRSRASGHVVWQIRRGPPDQKSRLA